MSDPIAIFADVHADAPALREIIAEIKAAKIKRIWCLGDFCSGGPNPAECFDLTMDNCELVLVGNHELFVTMRIFLKYAGGWADAAYEAYQDLGESRLKRLSGLSPQAHLPQVELVHGALTDPASDFIRSDADVFMNLNFIRQPLLLYAHTHKAAFHNAQKLGLPLSHKIEIGKKYRLPDHIRCALNPGAGCDSHGGRWLELDLGDQLDRGRSAIWHQTSVAGHGGIASITQ